VFPLDRRDYALSMREVGRQREKCEGEDGEEKCDFVISAEYFLVLLSFTGGARVFPLDKRDYALTGDMPYRYGMQGGGGVCIFVVLRRGVCILSIVSFFLYFVCLSKKKSEMLRAFGMSVFVSEKKEC
jgi:hypothetical protein